MNPIDTDSLVQIHHWLSLIVRRKPTLYYGQQSAVSADIFTLPDIISHILSM